MGPGLVTTRRGDQLAVPSVGRGVLGMGAQGASSSPALCALRVAHGLRWQLPPFCTRSGQVVHDLRAACALRGLRRGRAVAARLRAGQAPGQHGGRRGGRARSRRRRLARGPRQSLPGRPGPDRAVLAPALLPTCRGALGAVRGTGGREERPGAGARSWAAHPPRCGRDRAVLADGAPARGRRPPGLATRQCRGRQQPAGRPRGPAAAGEPSAHLPLTRT